MKKNLLTLLSILVLASTIGVAEAKTTANNQLADGIKLYKSGNYTQCFQELSKYVKKHPDNAIAHYYIAMSAAQAGRSQEAIASYNTVLSLTADTSNIHRYAQRGLICVKDDTKCTGSGGFASLEEAFILGKFGPNVTEEVRGEIERLKIEQLMREMNHMKEISPDKFKEYPDFSAMNTTDMPSNDEIVAAMKTLQKAGFNNMLNNGYASEISMFTGMQNQQSPLFGLMSQSSSLNPQVIQAMLTNNMMSGF